MGSDDIGPPSASCRTEVHSLASVGVAILGIVAFMYNQSTEDHLATIERQIHQSLIAKGTMLTDNHALALKGLALDNALGDVHTLVQRTVSMDESVVYGLYLDADGEPWVYASPETDNGEDRDAYDSWEELGVPPSPIVTILLVS